MPPVANKGKAKGRDARRSRSRNTTPSSVISAGTAPPVQSLTPYLNVDTSKLHVQSHPQYGDILDRLDTKSGVPEPKHLEILVEQLRQLSEAAEARAQVCDAAMRELADKRKAIADEEREQERIDREIELRKAKAKRDTEERSDGTGSKRGPKPNKRKERSGEKLPLSGDGVEVKVEGKTGIMRLPSDYYTWSIRLSSRRRHHLLLLENIRLPSFLLSFDRESSDPFMSIFHVSGGYLVAYPLTSHDGR
jgi:transcriptional adapter 3